MKTEDITLGELLKHESAVIRHEAQMMIRALESWEPRQELATWQEITKAAP